MPRRGSCYIGTSGWSYAHWSRGRFYPVGLPQSQWLSHLAGHFNTVEVNMSFYQLPKKGVVGRWRESVGTGFCFAVKLWRGITHDKRLHGYGEELRVFLEAFMDLGERRGPLLVQLPPSLQRDVELLDWFLTDLSNTAGSMPWRVAVEFRDPSWLHHSVSEVLGCHGAAIVLSDMPRCPVTESNDVGFVYMRRHGPGGRYRGCYDEAMILDDARRVNARLDDGKDVYVYFNNDVGGYAVDNARQLIIAVAAQVT